MDTDKNTATGLTNENDEKNTNLPITNTTNSTYYEHRDKNGGFEIDLVFLRERGVPLKYLSITVQGLNIESEPPSPNSATVTIGTKEEFDKFKNFIAQLKWE